MALTVLASTAQAQNVIVTDDISSDVTWTSNNTYILNGLIFVDDGATLTIEPGTVVKAYDQDRITAASGDGASALVVRRGAQIQANGTASEPIIFTAFDDDIDDDQDLDETNRGLWGGVILLGDAPTNANDGAGNLVEVQIEGIPAEEDARYGGDDADDSSGTLRYVSIRHGGFSISGVEGDEINGLTLGAVGSGTTVEYVEVYANLDDCFEWFGGTVRTKYLVGAFCGDDTFDYDQGFRGLGQYWFSIQAPDIAGRAAEQDGGDNDLGGEGSGPFAIPVISNATYIGAGTNATPTNDDGNNPAVFFRDNAGGKYYNSVYADFPAQALRIEDLASGADSRARLEAGDLVVANSLFSAFGAGDTFAALVQEGTDRTPASVVVPILSDLDNEIVSASELALRGVSRSQDGGLDPRPAPGSPARSGANFDYDPIDDDDDDSDDDDGDFFDEVSFIGAFGSELWIEDWTALDQNGYVGAVDAPGDEVTVTDDIDSDVTWTSNNTYLLNGLIFVDDGATLTIEPGTVVKGIAQDNITSGDGASALIVRRGAQIQALGEANDPVIFTAEEDDLNGSLLPTDRGLWGGVILLGDAPTNANDGAGNLVEVQIEGIPAEEDARYGGDDADDSSGTLRYVSIRHGGFSISGVEGDEINGLTLGAVGSGTTVEYVEVYANLDDCFEWFGGTVNTRYLAGAFCGDDTYDYDQGFSGLGQFWFSIQGADIAGRAGEHDGGDNDLGGEGSAPFAIPVISNATYVGSGESAVPTNDDGNNPAVFFRDNAGGKYYNSVFADFPAQALRIEDLASGADSRARLEAGDLVVANSVFSDFGAYTGTLASLIQEGTDRTPASVVVPLLEGVSYSEAGVLRAIDRDQDGNGLDPRPLSGGAAASGADFDDEPLDEDDADDFFREVGYLGAFDPNGAVWLTGWSALFDNGFLTGQATPVEGGPVAGAFGLTVGPNPTRGQATVRFTLDRAQDVRIALYDMLGREVSVVAEGAFGAGETAAPLATGGLPSGVYILRLQGEGDAATQQISVVR